MELGHTAVMTVNSREHIMQLNSTTGDTTNIFITAYYTQSQRTLHTFTKR